MIRAATLTDLSAIQEIERHSFRTVFTPEALATELATPHARLDVWTEHEQLRAFASYWLVVPGAQHAAEVRILSIATHPDHRRRGLAAELLRHAIRAGQALGATLGTLEVRKGNAPAIALYARHGFTTVHVRQRYYQDDGEDALVMLADLTRSCP